MRSDLRLRIAGLLVLAFCFSSLQSPLALGAMVVVTVLVVIGSGVPLKALLARLRVPGLLVAGLVLVLPFVSGGTVLATIGPIALRAEGLAAAMGIAARFLCIFSLIVALVGTVPMPKILAALRGLGVPEMLTDMGMLAMRHVADLRDDFRRMRVAMRLRGAPGGFWSGQFRANGWALASMLVRSHERSERVYHAMILRGHGAPGAASKDVFVSGWADRAMLAGLALAGAGLLALEHLA